MTKDPVHGATMMRTPIVVVRYWRMTNPNLSIMKRNDIEEMIIRLMRGFLNNQMNPNLSIS